MIGAFATATGLFNRETIYGLGINGTDGEETRLLLSVDAEQDWNDWMDTGRPRGVRLETVDQALISYGSLGPDRVEPFLQLFDRAVDALGLSSGQPFKN